jgi:predicted metal-binding membrane protein
VRGAYDRQTLARTLRVPAALTALALAGWVASALTMQGMATMDGPGPLVSFLWLWVAMSAAMMLPALVPAASLAGRVGRSGTVFFGAYFAVWAATGLAAFEAARALTGAGRWLSVAAILVAAAYQLSPLKDACLRRCRSPLGLLLRRGALSAGLEHGVVCLGCCWALMLALLAVGIGSMLGMAAVAAAIFVEKATSVGARASAPVALVLAGAAVWVAL